MQYDPATSTGPPPPAAVLVTGLSALTPYQHIRRHFAKYGTFVSFEPQVDRVSGNPLGMVWIKFETHEIAKAVVAGENGRRVSMNLEGQIVRVQLDGEQKTCKAIVRGIYERKRQERIREEEIQKIKDRAIPILLPPRPPTVDARPDVALGLPTPTSMDSNVGQQQRHAHDLQQPVKNHLPAPITLAARGRNAHPGVGRGAAPHLRSPENSYRPLENSYRPPANSYRPPENSYRPVENLYRPRDNGYAGRQRGENRYRPPLRSPSRSRSPSPMPAYRVRKDDDGAVRDMLSASPHDHVRVEGAGRSLREDDLRAFFDRFDVDKVRSRPLHTRVPF